MKYTEEELELINAMLERKREIEEICGPGGYVWYCCMCKELLFIRKNKVEGEHLKLYCNDKKCLKEANRRT